MKTGTIVGIVIGGVVLIGGVVAVIVIMKKKKEKEETQRMMREQQQEQQQEEEKASKPTPKELIILADSQYSWDQTYALGKKYNLSKEQVNAIVPANRNLLAGIKAKYPEWESIIREEILAL